MKSDFPLLNKTIEDGMVNGLHIGATVHVRRDGEVIADFAVGTAGLDPYLPLRPDQRLLWLSAGKPVTALAIGILSDRGRVSFDMPICAYIPDFARHGKDAITVRNVLMQTHAYRPPRVDWPRLTREQVIEQICEARMIEGATPGQYAAYDPQTGWYLLSEIVARVTGRPNHEFVKKELFEPLGCESASIGMDAQEWTEGRDRGNIAVLHDTTGSARARTDLSAAANGETKPAVGYGDEESAPVYPGPWAGDDAQRAAAHNPGGGAMGTAANLATIYQCMLDGGKTQAGVSLLRNSTVKEMTSRQRVGLKDNSFGQVVDWGLGFLVNSARYGALADPYGYGRYASDDTFGHGGMQSSSAYADPVNRLAVAIIFNGLPGEPKHQKRVNDANTALYRDLGLG